MASRLLRRRSVALSHCRTVPKICCVLQVSKVTLRSIEHWEDTLSVSVTLRHCSYPNLSHFVCCEILFQTQQRFVQLRDWNSGKQNMWEIPCWETCCVWEMFGNVRYQPGRYKRKTALIKVKHTHTHTDRPNKKHSIWGNSLGGSTKGYQEMSKDQWRSRKTRHNLGRCHA
jgi:hypothetical protein